MDDYHYDFIAFLDAKDGLGALKAKLPKLYDCQVGNIIYLFLSFFMLVLTSLKNKKYSLISFLNFIFPLAFNFYVDVYCFIKSISKICS